MGPFPRARIGKKRGGRFSNGNPLISRLVPCLTSSFGRKLEDILRELTPLEQRGKVTRFLNGTKDTDKLSGVVEDIRDAMMDYQVCPNVLHP